MKATLRTFLAIICIGIITISAVLIVHKVSGNMRVDLTEYKLYTLSQGTRNILKDLNIPGNQPVTLRLYFSRVAAMKSGTEHIRYWTSYYLYVRDLLEEYTSLSEGKLRLEVVDPRTYSEEEEEAINYKLKGFPLSKDENFFFGLVAKTETGTSGTIDFFEPQRQEFVEYDVSRLISRLMNPARQTIGIISSLPVMGTPQQMAYMMQMQGQKPQPPWVFIEALKMDYDVQEVNLEAYSIPEEIDTLMLIHPKDLSEKTLFAIDQYVMKGGKLLAFIDPHCFIDQPMMDPKNPQATRDHTSASELNALLKKWGVWMNTEDIAADRKLALPPNKPFLPWLGLTEESFNKDELVTGRLHSVTMAFAGILRKSDNDAGTEITPLLSTSEVGNAWRPRSRYLLMRPNPDMIRREVVDGHEPIMLACRIYGKLKSNFPDGIVIEEDEAESAPEVPVIEGEEAAEETVEKQKENRLEAIKETAENNTVIVVADVDMLTNDHAYQQAFFGYQQVSDNVSVAFNALEFLAGSTDLISIRSRGQFIRPFLVVVEIEQDIEKETTAEIERLSEQIEAEKNKLKRRGQGANQEDFKDILDAAMSGRIEIEKRIQEAERQVIKLKNKRREKVEELEDDLRMKNMVAAPAVILLIAIVLAALRYSRAKRYAARRV